MDDPHWRARDHDVNVGPDGQIHSERPLHSEYGKQRGGDKGFTRSLYKVLTLGIVVAIGVGALCRLAGTSETTLTIAVVVPLVLTFVSEIILIIRYYRRNVAISTLVMLFVALLIGLSLGWWLYKNGIVK